MPRATVRIEPIDASRVGIDLVGATIIGAAVIERNGCTANALHVRTVDGQEVAVYWERLALPPYYAIEVL